MSKFSPDDFSFDAVVPMALVLDKNIEGNAIRTYLVIRGLTRLHGYCYATNAYIAESIGASESSIKRHIASLKDAGWLFVSTNKQGVHWQREIYLGNNKPTTYENGLNKSLRKSEIDPSKVQDEVPPSSKVTHNLKSIKDKENLKEEESQLKPSADASVLASKFIKKLKEIHGDKYKEPQPGAYDIDFDRLLRLDKYTSQEVDKIMSWAMQEPFWQGNIISSKKLRQQFLKLKIQMENQWKPKNGQKKQELIQADPMNKATLVDPDTLRRLFQIS
jgi:biotin operon repressor